MIPKFVRFARFISGLILLSVALAFVSPKTARSFQAVNSNRKVIDYRIGKTVRTVKGPPTLIVYISVKPSTFNQNDMILLAHDLNKRFSDEERVSAWIFDSYQSAKHFVPHPHSPTYGQDFAALRGFYDLDRKSGKESLSFASSQGKPRDEIVITLSENKSD